MSLQSPPRNLAFLLPALLALGFACTGFVPSLLADEIHDAARSGDLDKVKQILANTPKALDKPNQGNLYTPLHWAVNYGKPNVVDYLLDQGANVNAKTSYKYTPLHLAAMGGNKQIITALFDKKPEVNAKDNNGFTPIMYAVSNNNSMNLINLWIEAGADLDVKNRQKQSLLHLACNYGRSDLAKALIEKGMPFDEADQYGNTPLMTAASRNQSDTVKLLLDKGANVNVVASNNQFTLLHMICQSSALDCFKLVIDKIDSVDTKNNQGQTPLMLAAYARQPEMVTALLEKGADPDTTSQNVYLASALHAACLQASKECVKALLDKKANASVADQNGDTPLHIAGRGGAAQYPQPLTDENRKLWAEIVELLLAAKADVNLKNKQGSTPFALAIGRQNYQAVDLMIPKATNVSIDVPGEASVLHWACRHGLENSVNLVTTKSSDAVHKQDSEGKTPFFLACEGGHDKIVGMLLKFDPKLDAKCSTGETPLLVACWNGHADVVNQLISNGANTGATAPGGQTALHMAAWGGHKQVVETLLKKDIQADIKTESGYTPLHAAAWQGHNEIIDLLVKSGCAVDVQDNDGVTPLHKAIRAGKFETVKALVALNADPNKEDAFGFDAVDKSKNNKNKQIVDFFADR